MNPHDVSITLSMRHPRIDPAELTRQLGFEPQHAWRAGEARPPDDDDYAPHTYRESYWVGVVPSLPHLVDPALLARHSLRRRMGAGLIEPQARLHLTLLKMKREPKFWRTFAEEGGTIACLVRVHTPEHFQLEMSPLLLLALVDLRITLSIEVDAVVRAAA
jgi:hypothetical protein